MSYNIRNAKGMDNKIDYDRIAAVIRAEDPDVVALQELDSATNRSGGKDVLKEIADRCGYHYNYGAAIVYDGGRYGVGVLSKEIPLRVTNVPLPGKEERRNLEIVEFRKFVLFASHFSLTEADRDSTVEIVNREMRNIRKPIFLAGDFNASPSSAAINRLKDSYWQLLSGEAPTFPANKPRTCIDYIFALKTRQYRVSRAEVVPDSMASDHRPVIVDLK
jgi:endonuclease/exonuclease/phosphatase family metal-dependent hydrolase